MYASGFAEAYNSPIKGNLVGIGSAPEGLDNNDVVYELLADAAWTTEALDLNTWYKDWCKSRYGSSCDAILQAWDKFHNSVYSSLYSYPRYRWQTVTYDKRRKRLQGASCAYIQLRGVCPFAFLKCGNQSYRLCKHIPLWTFRGNIYLKAR